MNPFDDPDGRFLVLVNELGQLSLWPAFAPVPAGWSAHTEPGSRDEALGIISRDWPTPPHEPGPA